MKATYTAYAFQQSGCSFRIMGMQVAAVAHTIATSIQDIDYLLPINLLLHFGLHGHALGYAQDVPLGLTR